MFEQSLKITNTLAGNARRVLLTRLDRVRNISHEFGYGVGDEMDKNHATPQPRSRDSNGGTYVSRQKKCVRETLTHRAASGKICQ
jgi:hypothetical protein